MKAFVLATPISGPAWVRKIKSESLVRVDSGELQIQSDFTVLFIFFAINLASIVFCRYFVSGAEKQGKD